MFVKNNKGQSALEYLMTYGWAVIAILVVIGLLYWLTTAQPTTTCSGFSNLPITNKKLDATGLSLELTNGTGRALSGLVVDGNFTQAGVTSPASSASTTLASGEKKTVTISKALSAGEVAVALLVRYNDGTFPQSGTGSCRGAV